MKSAHVQNPILIIDRDGLIGESLSQKLAKEFPIVFISKKITAIPDNQYSRIIFIDEKGRDSELIPKLIKKARNINADFIFAQGLFSKRKYTTNKVLHLCPSAKMVIFGDVFDKQLISGRENSGSVVNKFIFQAQRFGKIQVLGNGLGETYPVFLQDVVGGLIDLIFGMHSAQSLFYLFPKHPVPEISLAHMLQKNNPEIKVDFAGSNHKLKQPTLPLNGKNLLGDQHSLAKRIRAVDIKGKIKERGRSSDKSAKGIKIFGFIAWALIFLLFSPFVFTLLFSRLGLSTLNYAQREMDKNNLSIAKNSAHLSQTFFSLGKQTVNIFSLQAKIAGQEKKLKRLLEDMVLGGDMSTGLVQLIDSETYFQDILRGRSKDSVGDFAKGRNALRRFLIILDKLKAEGKTPLTISQNLKDVNSLIKFLSATSEILPNLLGMEGEKTYLILFQDNMELRPGGGVIDSYGILKLNQGKITQFTLSNVDDADKQLKGHAEPPFGLRRYLPSRHWYMRDSNFDVDFVKSALSAANFFFAETGQKVSGVIGIDSSLQAKLTGAKPPYHALAQTISDALLQKHLLLTFNDSQNIFTVNGWSSSLWDGREENQETFNDFIGISEANLGRNKINKYIKRQISQNVILEDSGSISEELTISYKNEGKTGTSPEYNNYLRIILPKNTLLSEISINNLERKIVDAITDPLIYEAKNFKAPQGLEVEKVQEDGKAILGFLVKIPAGEIVKVKLKYTLEKDTLGLNSFIYNLKIFKQPGTDNIRYSYSLAYPNYFSIVENSDEVTVGEGVASFSEKILGDKNLIINFAKK